MDVTILFCFGIWCYIFTIAQGALIYSNTWAVHIEGGLREARSVAEQTGFTCEDEVRLTDHRNLPSLPTLFLVCIF